MMATKKTNTDNLLAMLGALEGKRPAAAGLKVLVQKKAMNEQQIIQLLHMFLDMINETRARSDLSELMKTTQK